MNVKEYIASGMVESYVMGLLSETERLEFESLCLQYPEIAHARRSFELTLEEQLLADAKVAPAHLRQTIIERLNSASVDNSETDQEQESIPQLHTGRWKWIAAAALVLLAATAYWAVSLNGKYRNSQEKIAELENKIKNAGEPVVPVSTPQSDFKMASIKDVSASATIYWDTVSKDVYLMVNNMPKPASGKQYQLWALLPQNQGALDLGMIELRQERMLYRMKNVQNAQAFAITLEPVGGSPKPTSTPMVSTKPVNL